MAPTINLIRYLMDVPAVERNLGMVVEVPRVGHEPAYRSADNPAKALNHFRWRYVSDLHIVMPNIQQVYICQTLQYKHYHCDKDILQTASHTFLKFEETSIPLGTK
jgi:hypothetical protein